MLLPSELPSDFYSVSKAVQFHGSPFKLCLIKGDKNVQNCPLKYCSIKMDLPAEIFLKKKSLKFRYSEKTTKW